MGIRAFEVDRREGKGRTGAAVARLDHTAVLVSILAMAACSDSPLEPQRGPLIDLPPDLAAVTFSAEGRSTAPYALLEIRHSDGFRGFVAVNAKGQPVWFFRTSGSPAGATRRANGNFVLLDNEQGLLEVTPDGRLVRELAQQARPGRFVHHDVTVTPRNTIFFIAEDWRPWPDTLIQGDAVWEWAPEGGSIEKRWSSFDHLDPEVDRGPRSTPSDWVHANSVSVGPRGNVLVSLPFLNQVVSIAPDFQALEWRLGGVGATILVDDPFDGQHTAAEVQPSQVLLFDNGFGRQDGMFSRAIEYDLGTAMAQKVWEWRPKPDIWTRFISSARRLPNGNTLVGFGLPGTSGEAATRPIQVFEVTRNGEVVWHLVVEGSVSSMYRATPLFEF